MGQPRHQAGRASELGKLDCLHDDNRVTLSAGTDMVFSEDRAARFEACAWHTVAVPHGNDVEAITPVLPPSPRSSLEAGKAMPRVRQRTIFCERRRLQRT